MKRFATLTILLLLTMLLLAGTAAAQQTGAAVYGWANSNRSGEATVTDALYGQVGGTPLLRNVANQLTHTAFQLNTNSCASCHMTHTAAGSNLLIRSTTSATCEACHDGTMGILDVWAPASGTGISTGMGGSVAAGTFAANSARTASMHDVDTLNVNLSSAPGGMRTGIPASGAEASWNSAFTCASCHAPHGSHSIRLLNVNPNNVALRTIAVTADRVAGGRWSPNARSNDRNVWTGVYGFNVANVVYSEARQVYVYIYAAAAVYSAPLVSGYTGSVSVTVYGRLTAPWTRIYHEAWNPNLNGRSDPAGTGSWVAADIDNLLNRYFTINFATGEVIQTATQRSDLISFLQNAPFNLSATDAANAPLNIDVARGLQVRARANATVLGANDAGREGRLVAGARQIDFLDPSSYDAPAYNLFCAACHTDYLPTISAGDQTGSGVGIYSDKFRHTINRGASLAVSPMPVRGTNTWAAGQPNLTGSAGTGVNRLMCLSCHFAHGADASMMLLADNTRVSAGAGGPGTPTDANQNDVSGALAAGGSSALKRYINQASCWHCHVRSSATPFQNTGYFWTQFPEGPTW